MYGTWVANGSTAFINSSPACRAHHGGRYSPVIASHKVAPIITTYIMQIIGNVTCKMRGENTL